MLIDANTNVEL